MFGLGSVGHVVNVGFEGLSRALRHRRAFICSSRSVRFGGQAGAIALRVSGRKNYHQARRVIEAAENDLKQLNRKEKRDARHAMARLGLLLGLSDMRAFRVLEIAAREAREYSALGTSPWATNRANAVRSESRSEASHSPKRHFQFVVAQSVQLFVIDSVDDHCRSEPTANCLQPERNDFQIEFVGIS
jgi:hypothetical protein